MNKEQNLLVIKRITVYNNEGLEGFRIEPGKTIKGTYDGFLGGFRCKTDDGIEYAAFHYEVLVC